MRVNDFFEQVFLINLKRRPDRLEQALSELERYEVEAEIVEGVDGKDLQLPPLISSDGSVPSPGDIGCTSSHFKVCQLAWRRNLKNYLVLEDDCKLSVNFLAQFDCYVKQLPDNWGLLYLGGSYNGTLEKVSTNINRGTNIFTTHALGVNASVYKALMGVWEARNEKVDLCVASLQEKVPTYAFDPFIIGQRPSHSDILNKYTDYKHLQV